MDSKEAEKKSGEKQSFLQEKSGSALRKVKVMNDIYTILIPCDSIEKYWYISTNGIDIDDTSVDPPQQQ